MIPIFHAFSPSRLAEQRFVRFRSGERNHHADAAVKGTVHFMSADITGGLQP